MSKYDEVLRPFTAAMERELHANSAKGDRPGWLKLSADTLMLELLYHHSKLQNALDTGDGDRILEHTADIANISMMLADVCGALSLAPVPAEPQALVKANVVDLRKALEVAQLYVKAGILFVPMPVLSAADQHELVAKSSARFEQLIEAENGKG